MCVFTGGFSLVGPVLYGTSLETACIARTSLKTKVIEEQLYRGTLETIIQQLYKKTGAHTPKSIGPIVRTGRYLSATEAEILSTLVGEYKALPEGKAGDKGRAILENQWADLQASLILQQNYTASSEIDPDRN